MKEDQLVLRTVYFSLAQDAQLRQLATELDATVSEIVRAALDIQFRNWASVDEQSVRLDIEAGRSKED